MRVAVLDDYHKAFLNSPPIERLRSKAEVLIFTEALTPQDRKEKLQGVEAVIALRERTRFDTAFFNDTPDLRLISQTGNGIAHVDLAAATGAGVLVATAPGGSSASTAELAIARILALMRHIPKNDAEMKAGVWPDYLGRNLEGKTLGLVGLGRVGGATAKLARAFGMKLLVWSKNMTPERAKEHGAESVDLETLFKTSDIVSIHLASNQETRGMIDERLLRLMKRDAFLVNTSRAAIVNEEALSKVVKEGAIAGAALDVYLQEPLQADHPLRRLPNVVLTPHVGWPTDVAYASFAESAVRVVEQYIDGVLADVVNPEARRIKT